MMLAGLRIFEDMNHSRLVEDWSAVRSHSRARRRIMQGHKQNIAYKMVPLPPHQFGNSVVMHPETARELRSHIRQQEGMKS